MTKTCEHSIKHQQSMNVFKANLSSETAYIYSPHAGTAVMLLPKIGKLKCHMKKHKLIVNFQV